MTVSVLILTMNEERNLPACLDSVSWCDDVVVLDSYSTDRTVEIAESFGARVIQRRFDNYGSHREAARQVDYRYPWVLAVDADERPDETLVQEITTIANQEKLAYAAYRVRRKDHFMGKWIRRSTLYPSWFVRFYRPEQIEYEARMVHEYPTVSGKMGELRGHLIHHSFNKGLDDWLLKHVRYAGLEGQENIDHRQEQSLDWTGLLATDPVRRRRALKALSFRLPCRPTLRFLYMYFLRMGFLDGYPGYTYCRLLAMYEYMIVLKIREIRRRERGLPF